jgi:hypothetical protein
VLDALAELDEATLGCCTFPVGVDTRVTVTTAGVSPATDGVGVMTTIDVCTSVRDGGADDAVTT